MPSVDLGAEVAPSGQQASVRRNPAQAHRLGMLPRRELPGPLSMLSAVARLVGLHEERPVDRLVRAGLSTPPGGRRVTSIGLQFQVRGASAT
jgi:hypothetical protein